MAIALQKNPSNTVPAAKFLSSSRLDASPALWMTPPFLVRLLGLWPFASRECLGKHLRLTSRIPRRPLATQHGHRRIAYLVESSCLCGSWEGPYRSYPSRERSSQVPHVGGISDRESFRHTCFLR